jgi:hypothetical protein
MSRRDDPGLGSEDASSDVTRSEAGRPKPSDAASHTFLGRANQSVPEPVARPGGVLFGRVVDEAGKPLAGLVLALEDARGASVDEVVTDTEGRYELEDKALIGVNLVHSDEEGDEVRPLDPLRSGERRQYDLVLGEVREIVGWVLDLAGDPQPGIRVELAAEQGGSRWTAVTDLGGGFRFGFAPATPVRVTADGGDLGMSSARLAGSEAKRRDVTLVLEPTTTLVVLAHPDVKGRVLVRTWSRGAHGADDVWNDYLGEAPPPPEGDLESSDETEPGLEDLALGESLRAFDPSDPETAFASFVIGLADSTSGSATLLRQAIEDRIEMSIDADEGRARVVARALLQKEPQFIDTLRLASERVSEGMGPIDALLAAGAEQPEPPTGEVIEGDVGDEGAPAETEILTLEPVEIMGMPIGPFGGDSGGPAMAALLEKLRARFGVGDIAFGGEGRAVVAQGPIGGEIGLRASFTYEVAISLDEPGMPGEYEIGCGQVFARAGDRIELDCGKGGEVTLEGRVLDSLGRLVSGVSVSTWESDNIVSVTTDATGRYALKVNVQIPRTCELEVTDPGQAFTGSVVRNVPCVPGQRQAVRDIVIRTPDEVPRSPTKPFGGVGATLSLSSDGVVLDTVREDGPLALEGVEPGTTVIAIDEVDASTFSLEDMLAMLRGEVGTEVALRLRAEDGELYDVLIERGLIDPGAPVPPVDANER